MIRTAKQKSPRSNRARAFEICFLGFDLVCVNRDASLVLRTFELDLAVDQGIDRVVSADSHIRSRVELRTALSNDDRAWLDDFAAKLLHTESLRITVATVSS